MHWSFTHSGFSEDFLQRPSVAAWVFVQWPSEPAEFQKFFFDDAPADRKLLHFKF